MSNASASTVARSKTSRILSAFLGGHKLTNLTALGQYGLYRLSDVVFKLRKRGVPILTIERKDVNDVAFAEYRLVKQGDKVSVLVPGPEGVKRVRDAVVTDVHRTTREVTVQFQEAFMEPPVSVPFKDVVVEPRQ